MSGEYGEPWEVTLNTNSGMQDTNRVCMGYVTATEQDGQFVYRARVIACVNGCDGLNSAAYQEVLLACRNAASWLSAIRIDPHLRASTIKGYAKLAEDSLNTAIAKATKKETP